MQEARVVPEEEACTDDAYIRAVDVDPQFLTTCTAMGHGHLATGRAQQQSSNAHS